MKRYSYLLSFSLLLLGCPPGSNGGPDAGPADAGVDAPADAGPCIPCSALLAQPPKPGDVPERLCPESQPIWGALYQCACDVEPLPPPGKGLCAGPCTYHPTDAGAWCDNLVQEPTCLYCIGSNPNGCVGAHDDCLADKGAP